MAGVLVVASSLLLAACSGDGTESEPTGTVADALADGSNCSYDWQCDSGHCCTEGSEHKCSPCCDSADCGGYPLACFEACDGSYQWWQRGCCLVTYEYCPYTDQCYAYQNTCSRACTPWE